MRQSTPQHWQDFWEEADRHGLEDVYDNDGRLVREITALGPLDGKCVLEVGAGTGRDAVALAKAGAEVLTLDYVHGSLGLTQKAAAAAGVEVQVVRAEHPDGTDRTTEDEVYALTRVDPVTDGSRVGRHVGERLGSWVGEIPDVMGYAYRFGLPASTLQRSTRSQ